MDGTYVGNSSLCRCILCAKDFAGSKLNLRRAEDTVLFSVQDYTTPMDGCTLTTSARRRLQLTLFDHIPAALARKSV